MKIYLILVLLNVNMSNDDVVEETVYVETPLTKEEVLDTMSCL